MPLSSERGRSQGESVGSHADRGRVALSAFEAAAQTLITQVQSTC